MTKKQIVRTPVLLVMGVTLFLAACSGQSEGGAPGAPAGGPGGPGAAGGPSVKVVRPQEQSLPLIVELPGRTSPFQVAEVRPQVTGIVQKRIFEEGANVKAGQLLYQIDAARYKANFESANAALARAQARFKQAQTTAKRFDALAQSSAVSQQAHEDAQATLALARADVDAARAARASAKIDLDFTRVTSPIAGRIDRSNVTPGALVTANQPMAMTKVQQLDPIYVDLSQSNAELMRLRRDLADGSEQPAGEDGVPVTIVLENGTPYAEKGTLTFKGASVDPQTGSVNLRVVVPNPNGILLPGMYVHARLEQGVRHDVILLPHAALTHDPRGRAVVMVVDEQGLAQPRDVETVQTLDGQWVVKSGLKSGEAVIVEGLQRLRPGMPVNIAPDEGAANAAAGEPMPAAAGAAAGKAADDKAE